MSNPNRRIQLQVTQQNVYTTNVATAFKLSITASNANLMPNTVFVMLYKPPTTGYPNGTTTFIGVATPAQLASLPVNTPDPTQPQQFYLTSSVSITYNDPVSATQGWLAIQQAVQGLKNSLDFGDGATSTSYWIGTPPPGG